MTKNEVMQLIIESIHADNREICKRMGMSEDQTEKSVKESTPALQLMAGNLYDRLKEKNLLV